MHFNKNKKRKYFLLLAVCFFYHFCKADATSFFNANATYYVGSAIYQSTTHLPFLSDTLPKVRSERKTGNWEILFDGKNMDKWRGKNSDSFPSARWEIKDGALSLNTKGKEAGDIITRGAYSDFELVADFKLTYAANSGIKYFVGEIRNKKTGKAAVNGPEYQIIDDYNHPEVKDHKHETSSTASCYLLYAPKNKKLNPEGQWNHVKIIARGKHVEHWLNGIMVVRYERGSADFLDKKAATKFADDENYGELKSGHILLTDHGDKVYFKNIKIRCF